VSTDKTAGDFRRKSLNLSVVLDISGSMSALDNTEKNRLDWAKESIVKILSQLREDDYISIVV
jgi:hypothetical protein